ncbi:hypothetical protein [Priestia megaterium]|uniref:hypothetical protein n=1 Tax=Priestia megaterium TaxID=1404 RepID=UPI0015CF5381|nr:hypothetical protein [Priestia megaterium]
MSIILNFIAFMLLSTKLSYCVYTMTDSEASMYFLNVSLFYCIPWAGDALAFHPLDALKTTSSSAVHPLVYTNTAHLTALLTAIKIVF